MIRKDRRSLGGNAGFDIAVSTIVAYGQHSEVAGERAVGALLCAGGGGCSGILWYSASGVASHP